jgi:hypothetical protein
MLGTPQSFLGMIGKSKTKVYNQKLRRSEIKRESSEQ